MVGLAEQIAAFQAALPQIKRDYGSVWALLVDGVVQKCFSQFEEAASFGLANFADHEFLIRHTDESIETVPFVLVSL